MPAIYDDDKLKSYPAEKIRQLYKNAQAIDSDQARQLIGRIEELGLLHPAIEGMRMDDPVFLAMEEIINSTAGKLAVTKAVEDGLPGLAGVEPMIVAKLGKAYSPDDMGTVNAGWLVGQMLMSRGYSKHGAGKMPSGSVAKTAAKWTSKK